MSLYRRELTEVEVSKNVYKCSFIKWSLNKEDIKDNNRCLLCELNNCYDTKWEFDECRQHWITTVNEKRWREEYSPSTIQEYKLMDKTSELLEKRVSVLLQRGAGRRGGIHSPRKPNN